MLVLGSVVATSYACRCGARGPGRAALCGLAACVLLSRIVTGAAAAVLATRRGRDLAGARAVSSSCSGRSPVMTMTGGGSRRALLHGLADVLAWTPLGWAWARAGRRRARRLGAGAAAPACSPRPWCLVLFAVWQRVLVGALRNPRTVDRRGRQSRRASACSRGFPATPMGAIAARAGTYWVRDPRFNLPAVMTDPAARRGCWSRDSARGSTLALAAMPVASAYLIGWGQHNDVGYDSTAFWMHVAAGGGRAQRPAGPAVPVRAHRGRSACPAYALLGPLVGGSWRLLPATLGAGAGGGAQRLRRRLRDQRGQAVCRAGAGGEPVQQPPGLGRASRWPCRPCAARAVVGAVAAGRWCSPCCRGSGWSWAPWAALVVGPAGGSGRPGCGGAGGLGAVPATPGRPAAGPRVDALSRGRLLPDGRSVALVRRQVGRPDDAGLVPQLWRARSGCAGSAAGRNWSESLETPPPTTNRSGHSSASSWL